jgi:glycosyltransferase involved in cell wall biosynthesis
VVSFVIPSYNNLRHLKNCYASIKKHARDAEVVLIDDGSTDGTYDWILSLKDDKVKHLRSEERLGHTIQYDVGISMASNEIVGILHADMILGPNYVNNVLKHLKKKTVVCGTRVEPPLHPEGKEKIVRDFGTDFDNLRIADFEAFCVRSQEAIKGSTTSGMFAPWILYKEDFDYVGGHDPLFAPFPYEDSDIFQRWILAGYKMIQSRDAFVYHLTCRGHRWNEQIGKDDEYYKKVSNRAARNYVRKWGSWIKNDSYQHPIIMPKYEIAFVRTTPIDIHELQAIEPWCSTLYLPQSSKTVVHDYVSYESQNTLYDLKDKIKFYDTQQDLRVNSDVVVTFDNSNSNERMMCVQNLSEILEEAEEGSSYEIAGMTVTVNKKIDRLKDVVFIRKKNGYTA